MVGTVRVQFTQADMSKFPKKKVRQDGHVFQKDTHYTLDMICEVSVADEVGILNFVVTCQGQICGIAKLLFSRE